jgi:uncharacterized membrane protein YphA (DoxX/SURF4 family)
MKDTLREFGPLPLRLMMAVGFFYHGFPKLTPAGHQQFVGMLQGIGVPSPEPVAWMVGALEVGGALLLLVGYQVRLIVLPLIVEMLVAMATVHWPSGFNTINITGTGPNGPTFGMPGIEFSLLYISILAALWFTGAGRLSFDHRRETEAIPREPGLAARNRVEELAETGSGGRASFR